MIAHSHLNKLTSKVLVMIPSPSSLSYMWNWGSLLGLCLATQIVTGIFLSAHYQANVDLSFSSLVSIMTDVHGGWILRFLHANTASAFFICLYCHIARSLYHGGYRLAAPWIVGTIIVLVLMATAFLGYVLPWGQMSYWGATVITNLLSAIPYWGETAVLWIWGGFSVGSPTLTRMFSAHFLFPFVVVILVLAHLTFLHSTGSSNPLGVGSDYDKISFHPFYSWKDMLGGVVYISAMIVLVLVYPTVFMDPENFIQANPLSTPEHIQPEWYFLFAYSILRSVPSKLGGVIALGMSVLVLIWLPLSAELNAPGKFNWGVSVLVSVQILNFFVLTWLGMMPVETPFVQLGRAVSVSYFTTFLLWGNLARISGGKK